MQTNSLNKQLNPTVSSTSIRVANTNKLDSILEKLQSRKRELLQILCRQQKMGLPKLQQVSYVSPKRSDWNIDAEQVNNACKQGNGDKHQNDTELGQNKFMTAENRVQKTLQQRKERYTRKIKKQTQQVDKIKQEAKQINQSILRIVIELQSNEIMLRNISEQVYEKYRQAFGFRNIVINNQTNSSDHYTYRQIYANILELEQQLKGGCLQMRPILCAFYRQVNHSYPQSQAHTDSQTEDMQQAVGKVSQNSDSQCDIIEYIVNMKLVNKLYGAILNKKSYRCGNNETQIIDEESSQQQYYSKPKQQKESHKFEWCDQQCSQSSQSEDNRLVDGNNRNKSDHDVWLKILKLLKILQKRANVQLVTKYEANGQQQIINGSNKYNSLHNLDINQFRKQVQNSIVKSKKLKNDRKLLKHRLDEYKTREEQLLQQIKIKQELINSFQSKIACISQQMRKKAQEPTNTRMWKSKQEDTQNMCINTCEGSNNPEIKRKQSSNKQLKQIEQAIKYFTIKKNTMLSISSPNHSLSKETVRNNCKYGVNHSSTDILSTEAHLIRSFALLSPQKYTVRSILDDKYNYHKQLNKHMYTSPDMYEKYHINHNKSLNFNFDNSCAQDSHKLAKTRKTSQTKHSLKYLLSPPKQVSTLQKRRAWK